MGLAFLSNKKDLLQMIRPALAGVASKHTIPALEGLLFRLEGSALSVCGYDMEKGILTVGEVRPKECGAVILNAKKIASIIKVLPDGDIELAADEKHRVKIKAGYNEFTLHGIEPQAFPNLPEFTGERSFSIGQNRIAEMIAATNFAVSQSDARPILTGELFRIRKRDLTVVALDNYRMAIREEKDCIFDNEETFSFVAPGKSLAELCRILKDTDDLLKVELTAKYIIFKAGDMTLFSRRLDGDYVEYRRALPKSRAVTVGINRSEFEEAVSRAALMVDEKGKKPIICEFAGGKLNITAASHDGNGRVSVGIVKEGADMRIGFNHRYLLDALRACQDEEITVSMTGELGAAVIEPAKNAGNYLYLVLPVRMRE